MDGLTVGLAGAGRMMDMIRFAILASRIRKRWRVQVVRRGRGGDDRACHSKARDAERILKSAAIARREGLRAASVPRVMARAGLTVGGFYAHFSSKAAMDAELIQTMLSPLTDRWLGGLDDASGLDWLRRAVKRYLSAPHRDNRDGCAYPAVLSEVAAAPCVVIGSSRPPVFDVRVRAFEAHAPGVAGISPRERALATMALTIGGLLLSRSSHGNSVSEEMLTACRKWALPESDRAATGSTTKSRSH
jgi:TetR/AcrR family transcriptional repressor of nem operon